MYRSVSDRVHQDELDPVFEEVFDLSVSLFTQLDVAITPDIEEQRKVYEQVVRLLHVYILPKIELGTKEKQYIEQSLGQSNDEVSKIETLICRKLSAKRKTHAELFEQRKGFLKSGKFSSTSQISKLDKRFLKIFLNHIAEDIKEKRDDLLNYERQMSPLRKSDRKEDKDRLGLLRYDRNLAHASFEQLLHAREEITNNLNNLTRNASVKVRSTVDLESQEYLKKADHLDTFDKAIHELLSIKVCIVRVREAASLSLKQIDRYGRSFGYDRHQGSSCDACACSRPESWATLEDRVSILLRYPKLHFGTTFRIFCLRMKEECLSHKTMLESNAESMVRDDTCRGVCVKVLKHISDMSEGIACEILGCRKQNLPSNVFEKVFACYERHVSEELLGDIGQVFEIAYKSQCLKLCKLMTRQQTAMSRRKKSSKCRPVTKSVPTVVNFVDDLSSARCLTDKLRQVKELVKFAETLLNQEALHTACSDDFISKMIELMSSLDYENLLKLVSQTRMVEGLIPEFWTGTSHSYAVVTVLASHTFLAQQVES